MISKVFGAISAAIACLTLAGCGASRPVTSDEAFAPGAVVLDGSIHEWPEEAALLADDHYWYFRVSMGETRDALQAAPQTLALWLDLDSRRDTGAQRLDPPPAADLGIDLEVQFSPPRADGSPGTGVTLYLLDASGARTPVGHSDADFMFTPTFAAEWHEGRISRSIIESLSPLRDSQVTTGIFVVLDGGAPTNMWSDPFRAENPARDTSERKAFATVPERSPDTIRIMSWNVLRDAPVENAAPFARVLDVVKPDVVLVQEWDYAGPQLAAWFTALVAPVGTWHALASDAWGVGIVSRYPLESLGPMLSVAGEEVRFAGAVAATPMGPIAVGSTHLTCCGAAGSEQDVRRVAEAEAIKQSFAAGLANLGVTMRVVGGDMNLVGTRTPLEVLQSGLDADGSDLVAAETYVLGDGAQYTWSDPESEFTPGRLDFMLVGDARAEIVRAFVLDTARLQPEALARMGLDATDTGASDHLPLVVDIRPR